MDIWSSSAIMFVGAALLRWWHFQRQRQKIRARLESLTTSH